MIAGLHAQEERLKQLKGTNVLLLRLVSFFENFYETLGLIKHLLERTRISTAGQRGYHILWRLAQEGVICFAARSGKQQMFALLEEWVPQVLRLGRDAALAELARRCFVSHGPATLQDFVWWTGLKASDAKAGLDLIQKRILIRWGLAQKA